MSIKMCFFIFPESYIRGEMNEFISNYRQQANMG